MDKAYVEEKVNGAVTLNALTLSAANGQTITDSYIRRSKSVRTERVVRIIQTGIEYCNRHSAAVETFVYVFFGFINTGFIYVCKGVVLRAVLRRYLFGSVISFGLLPPTTCISAKRFLSHTITRIRMLTSILLIYGAAEVVAVEVVGKYLAYYKLGVGRNSVEIFVNGVAVLILIFGVVAQYESRNNGGLFNQVYRRRRRRTYACRCLSTHKRRRHKFDVWPTLPSISSIKFCLTPFASLAS